MPALVSSITGSKVSVTVESLARSMLVWPGGRIIFTFLSMPCGGAGERIGNYFTGIISEEEAL
jgi:hypothetical protein